MILQYQFKLDKAVPYQTAYPLYAALLERAPEDFSAWVHEAEVTPISQYVRQDTWNVSVMGRYAAQTLAPILDGLEGVRLRRMGLELKFQGRQSWLVDSPRQLLECPLPDRVRLSLLTPTAFKSNNAYQQLPTQRLILQSLIQKWNGCFGDLCPIEDEGQGLEALAAGLVYENIRLQTRQYPLKRTRIPGAVGTIDLDNRLTGFHRQLCDALLTFGTFAGVGVKTTLGMGGMNIEQKRGAL